LERRIELPPIKGVKVAFLGLLPGKQFLQLLEDNEGQLEQRMFLENVRAYLGDTKANLEIAKTVKGDEGLNQEWFALLHNGITIVARQITQLGPTLTVTDCQVVNGCQTSHVLYSWRSSISESDTLQVPVRIIVTDDSEITDWIVRATNLQNEMRDEVFVATEDFQKDFGTILFSVFQALPDKARTSLRETRSSISNHREGG
jgi:hypothetical protein